LAQGLRQPGTNSSAGHFRPDQVEDKMVTARKSETNGTASGLVNRVAEDMSEFSERARRALDDAGEFASDVADNAVRGGRKAAKFVVREVKEHPLRTLAIGAAVGAVVAAVIMLRNRSDD
jgi:ElaB/YqjD/DUF883 family membrane-anchored ribosome-binding protein